MKILITLLFLAIIIAAISWRYLYQPKPNSDWPSEVVESVRVNQASREIVRTQNPELFNAISACLFKNDPMGINFTTNTDEYEPEVGTIIPRLPTCTSEEDVLGIVYEEFCAWFGTDNAGKKDNYRQVSKNIWEIWNNQSTQQGGPGYPPQSVGSPDP